MNATGPVPYDSFSEKGVDGLFEWYTKLGVTNVCDVHVNPETAQKICAALDVYHKDPYAVNIFFVQKGPSGYHQDVPTDTYRLIKKKKG